MLDSKLYVEYADNLYSYKEAKELMETKKFFFSRKEWDGFHFMRNGKYYILLKTGELLIEPEDVYCTDKNDWIMVLPTYEAFLQLIEQLPRD